MSKEAQAILKRLNTECNLSLEEIAAKMKYSYSAVYYWLRGERNPHYLAVSKLKQILNRYEKRNKK